MPEQNLNSFKSTFVNALFVIASKGDAECQYELGTILQDGLRGEDKIPEAAAEWFLRAVERGHAGAACRLSSMYRTGNGLTENLEEAEKLLEKAEDLIKLSEDDLLEKAKAEQLSERAQTFFQEMIDAHRALCAEAQFELALIYDDSPDYVEAAQDGKGNKAPILRDEAKAKKLYEKAAKNGNADAANNLGNLYRDMRDLKNAEKAFITAIDAGCALAYVNLANLYLDDIKTVKHRAHAIYLYWVAAVDKGLLGAQLNLGILYNVGDNVHKNGTIAVEMIKAAARQGFEPAVDIATDLKLELSPPRPQLPHNFMR